jgi:KUP system potassium uptake protein
LGQGTLISLPFFDNVQFPSQGLEDQFDRKSRRRLDGFIVPEGAVVESEKREESEFVQFSAADVTTNLYYITPPLPGSAGEVERHALTRLPIFAIFHGIAHERGVPPSFTGTPTPLFDLRSPSAN